MKFSELAPRERHNFVYFLLFFFFYYFIMSAYFPFFPVWLADVNHLTKTETGIVFSAISLFAIICQPIFGLISDKLGLRKHLLWTITILLILFAPFFIFVFSPLLQSILSPGRWWGDSIWELSSPAVSARSKPILSGSVAPTVSNTARFASLAVSAGRSARQSPASCLVLIPISPSGSPPALRWCLGVLLWFSRPESSNSAQVMDALGANRQAFFSARRR
ncbi:Lactose-proton symport [Raoultella ornithinolytica]|nr:Lactose-proton symport [Raoultella ornithinolytica]